MAEGRGPSKHSSTEHEKPKPKGMKWIPHFALRAVNIPAAVLSTRKSVQGTFFTDKSQTTVSTPIQNCQACYIHATTFS